MHTHTHTGEENLPAKINRGTCSSWLSALTCDSCVPASLLGKHTEQESDMQMGCTTSSSGTPALNTRICIHVRVRETEWVCVRVCVCVSHPGAACMLWIRAHAYMLEWVRQRDRVLYVCVYVSHPGVARLLWKCAYVYICVCVCVFVRMYEYICTTVWFWRMYALHLCICKCAFLIHVHTLSDTQTDCLPGRWSMAGETDVSGAKGTIAHRTFSDGIDVSFVVCSSTLGTLTVPRPRGWVIICMCECLYAYIHTC
jgi:hypothetical protein